jgi:eukaryotic-like serine/threonine-protein kinase
MAGAIIGTVSYMAPEQARGEVVDQRADIYAFGLIMYDMLLGGRRSERAASAIAELEQRMGRPRHHLAASIRSSPRRSTPSSGSVSSLAGKRFQTTLELEQALDRLDDNGKPLPIMRRVSRRTMAAAAIVVVLLLGGTYYMANRLAAPVKEPAPVSVVIADFQNNTNDPTFDHTLGQTLRRALESASFITAFDRTRLRPTFGVAAPERFDGVAARQLAIKQGLGVVLAGSIAPRGTAYDITIKATEPMTGNELASVTRRAASKDQVLSALTRLVTSVRDALGDETSADAQQLAMKTISTTAPRSL